MTSSPSGTGGLYRELWPQDALEAHHAFAWIKPILFGAKGQTCG